MDDNPYEPPEETTDPPAERPRGPWWLKGHVPVALIVGITLLLPLLILVVLLLATRFQ